eukprot:TRINITY_DN3525_c0_g2_i3.p1 TRINITY_DN3525_c0_g2~~TRINITY_DN3525_c0_g2_i3.p1  ORF type:complete len:347 (+),score=49.63 TRINITY_DN3525_c0_g2_i3:128-1168(+)
MQELGKSAVKMAAEVKVAGKSLGKLRINKECGSEQKLALGRKVSLEQTLQDAISRCEINKAYEVFSKVQIDCPKELVKACLNMNNGLPLLFSCASLSKKKNLLHCLEEMNEEARSKKDKSIVPILKPLMIEKVAEYNKVKKVLEGATFHEQKESISTFIKEAPKKIHDFSKLVLSQYLESKVCQIELAQILKTSKPEQAAQLINLPGFLQVIYYASKVPLLDSGLEEMVKRSSVHKNHMAIPRLCGYAEIKDWVKFNKLVNSLKLPNEFIARICISYGNKKLAVEHIKKIVDCEVQIDLFVEIEAYQHAANAAVSSKNTEMVEYLKSKSPYCDYFIKNAKLGMEKF